MQLVLKMRSQTISLKRYPSMLYKIMPLHIDMIPVMQNHIRAVVNVTNSKKKRLSSPGVLTERVLPWFEFFFIQK